MANNYGNTQRWRLKAKRWVIKYAGGKCQVCQYDKYQGNLVFHHIGDKKETVSRMINATVSWSQILDEINKCVLLCHNCHGEVHAGLAICPEIDIEKRIRSLSEIESEKPMSKDKIFRPCAYCKKLTNSNKFCGQKCSRLAAQKILWPPNEELAILVWKHSMTFLAKQLNVSGNAIKKRCITRGISIPIGFEFRNRKL